MLRRAMHYLAKGLGCGPEDIMRMEFVEFVLWVELETAYRAEELRAAKAAGGNK